jgi:hypothetical protein
VKRELSQTWIATSTTTLNTKPFTKLPSIYAKKIETGILGLDKMRPQIVFFSGNAKENAEKVNRYELWCGARGLDEYDEENWISFCEGEQE